MSKTTFNVNRENLTVEMERTFNAPREKVFNAFIDPKAISSWWGPRSLKITIDKMEPVEGGSWRFIHKDASGNEFAFNGIYKEINKPCQIVQTLNFEGIPETHELVETAKFEAIEGKTRVRTISEYQNIADLEGMVSSGMEAGATEGWDRLAELIEIS